MGQGLRLLWSRDWR